MKNIYSFNINGVDSSINLADSSNNGLMSYNNYNDFTDLITRTTEITKKEITDESEEFIMMNDNETETYITINSSGVDAKNLKSNGESVLTTSDIDGLEKIDTEYDIERLVFSDNTENDIYAYISPSGTYINNFVDNNGKDKKLVDTLSSNSNLKLQLLPKYYSVVGRPSYIYLCQLFNTVRWKTLGYGVSFSGNCIRKFGDRVTIITSESGEYTITCNIYEYINGSKRIYNQSATVSAISELINKSVTALFIGDSRTDNSMIIKHSKEVLGDNLVLLGTRTTGGYSHEGYSGWSSTDFCSSQSKNSITNPFYNPDTGSFDFSYYMKNNNYTNVDVVNIFLGTNDLFSSTSVTNIQNMADSIHAYNSDIIVSIMTEYIIPFGEYYLYTGDDNRVALSTGYFEKLYNQFVDKESENTYLIASGSNIDDNYDWGHMDVSINDYTNDTMSIITDNIHPRAVGYTKMSECWLQFISNIL